MGEVKRLTVGLPVVVLGGAIVFAASPSPQTAPVLSAEAVVSSRVFAQCGCVGKTDAPRMSVVIRSEGNEVTVKMRPRLIDDSRCMTVDGIKACYAVNSICWWEGGDRCTSH